MSNLGMSCFRVSAPVRLFYRHEALDLRVSLLLAPLTLEASQDISRRLRDTVVRPFVKCGIALLNSGQRDVEINISGL